MLRRGWAGTKQISSAETPACSPGCGGHPSEIGGAKKKGIAHVHQLRTHHPALEAQAFACKQAAGRRSTWAALAQAHLPQPSAAGQVGDQGSSANHCSGTP